MSGIVFVIMITVNHYHNWIEGLECLRVNVFCCDVMVSTIEIV